LGARPQYAALRYMEPLESVPRGTTTGSCGTVHVIEPPGATKLGVHETKTVFWPLTLAYIVGAVMGYCCELTRYIVRLLVLSTMSVQLKPP
jgi:hypothetical protein